MIEDLGACNVNNCVNESVKDCEFCVGVSFCAIHEDHRKFHFRRCQILGCFNLIAQKNHLPIDDVCFHSKFPPCSEAYCLHNKFMFCRKHSHHDSHDVTSIPNIGYNFECYEISPAAAQGRIVYVCDSSLTEFDVLGTAEDYDLGSSDTGVAARYEAIFDSDDVVEFHDSGRKRRKSKVSKTNESQYLKDASVVVDVVDSSSGNRFRHKCPYCLRTVRGYNPDMKVALRRHWVWLCRISGTKKVDTALQIEDGVFLYPSSQLPPQKFLHSMYYTEWWRVLHLLDVNRPVHQTSNKNVSRKKPSRLPHRPPPPQSPKKCPNK